MAAVLRQKQKRFCLRLTYPPWKIRGLSSVLILFLVSHKLRKALAFLRLRICDRGRINAVNIEVYIFIIAYGGRLIPKQAKDMLKYLARMARLSMDRLRVPFSTG